MIKKHKALMSCLAVWDEKCKLQKSLSKKSCQLTFSAEIRRVNEIKDADDLQEQKIDSIGDAFDDF
jgi:hypothetical protein